MGRVVKFFGLSTADKCLLAKAMLLVWLIRLGLWLLPFRILRQLLTTLGRESATLSKEEPPRTDRIAWSVAVTSKYVPAASCLTQALVTKFLLGRCGYQALVRIGVARDETGKFHAHAWVESDGKVIIGGSSSLLGQYTPLPTWDEDS
jgi:Transglutaminase-like superfamily